MFSVSMFSTKKMVALSQRWYYFRMICPRCKNLNFLVKL